MEKPGFLSFLRARRTALLSVFLGAEVAVLLFVLAENAWPREVPAALGWTIYLGSFPWTRAWLAAGSENVGLTMAVIAASFGLNVVIVGAIAWYAAGRMAKERAP
ncbi:MAG TPA: hypothetical protein VLY46_07295 [Usitatibacter sp.]|nr:hypothetical protein [Usitatibacter sp.]